MYAHCDRRPIGVLEGHTGPVFCVRTDSINSRVYSIGNDNTIMVWYKLYHILFYYHKLCTGYVQCMVLHLFFDGMVQIVYNYHNFIFSMVYNYWLMYSVVDYNYTAGVGHTGVHTLEDCDS